MNDPYVSVTRDYRKSWDLFLCADLFTIEQRKTIKTLLKENEYLFYTESSNGSEDERVYLTNDSVKTVVDTLWPHTACWLTSNKFISCRTMLLNQNIPGHKIAVVFEGMSTRTINTNIASGIVLITCETSEDAAFIKLMFL